MAELKRKEIEGYFHKIGLKITDEGQDLMGERLKVGDKIVFATHRNASIRWVVGTIVSIYYRELIDDSVVDYRLIEKSKKDKLEYYYYVETNSNRGTKKCWNEVIKLH